MIVARFYIDKTWMTRGGILIEGAIASAKYHEEGWFPIESFNFGFEGNKGHDDAKNKAAPSSGAGGSTKPSGTSTSSASAGKDKNKDAFVEMKISKLADTATSDLMWLAMSHRTLDAAKGDKDKVSADVHVLASVELWREKTVVANVYATLMVHMEGVLLTGWGIDAGGDGRPKESISLKFDKAAMRYITTKDGKTMDPWLDSGWDQKENKPWPDSDKGWQLKEFEQYTPKLA